MSSVSQLDFLTPGSVWLRKDGRQAKFLFMTNTALKAKTQLTHPPQVIYADTDGNTYNRDIDGFFDTYKFHSVDGDLENKLGSLFVFKEEDFDDEDADDAATDVEADDTAHLMSSPANAERLRRSISELQLETPSVVALDAAVAPTQHRQTLADQLAEQLANEGGTTQVRADAKTGVQVGFAFAVEEGLTESPLSAQQLTDSLVVYSQDPNVNYTLTQHRLLFELSEEITIEKLRLAFAPSETTSTVDAFEVRTALGSSLVYWTHFIGVYPEYTTGGLYASVLVGTEDSPIGNESDFKVTDDDVAELPATLEQPEQTEQTEQTAEALPIPEAVIEAAVAVHAEIPQAPMAPVVQVQVAPVAQPQPEVQVAAPSAPAPELAPVVQPQVVITPTAEQAPQVANVQPKPAQ